MSSVKWIVSPTSLQYHLFLNLKLFLENKDQHLAPDTFKTYRV